MIASPNQNEKGWRSYILRSIFLSVFSLIIVTDAQGQDWIQLYDSTKFYWETDWDKCVSLLERALPLAEHEMGNNSQEYGVLLNDLALSYYFAGQKDNAEKLLKESLKIKENIFGKDHEEYALAALNLAGIYLEDGRHLQAEENYLQSLDFLAENSTEFRDDYLQTLSDIGLLYENMGSFSQSELYLKRLIDFLSDERDSSNELLAVTLNSLGRVNRKSGKFDDARKNIDKSLSIIAAFGGEDHPEYPSILNNLGNLHFSLGEYKEAEQAFKKSLAIRNRNKSEQPRAYAESLNNLANLHQVLGDRQEAQRCYLEALKVFQLTLEPNNPELGTILNNLGSFYENFSMYDEALEMYEHGANIYQEFYGSNHPLYANTLNNLGSLYRSTQEFEKAEEAYLSSIEIYETTVGVDHPSFASATSNLGLLYTYLGNIEKAKPLLAQAIQIQETSLGQHHPSLIRSYNNMAVAHFIENDLEGAEPFFQEVIRNQLLQIKHVFPSLSEKEKEEFYSMFRDDIERFNTFALLRMEENPQILEEMYDLQLATKAILYRSTAGMRNNILSSNNPLLIREFEEWLEVREKLGYYYQKESAELVEQGIQLKVLEKKANDLEKSISLKSQLFAQENIDYSWKDIRDKLAPGEAAVEIIRFRKFEVERHEDNSQAFLDYGFRDQVNYAALVITPETKDHPEIAVYEHGKELESRYVAYYKNCIRFQLDDFLSYSMYWDEIKKVLEGASKVYFSPDGIYNLINVSAAYDAKTGRYVHDEKEIYYVTTTKDLLYQEEPKAAEYSGVFFANPDYGLGAEADVLAGQDLTADEQNEPFYINRLVGLPGTVEEVQAIDSLTTAFNWTNQVYLGEAALESAVKKVSNPTVLHIASHGFFSEKEVAESEKSGVQTHNYLLRSGLLLAGAKETLYRRDQGIEAPNSTEDGILTAYEAMNLRLEFTDLVVLSACESGLGYVQNGEGIYGLQRAFKVAGAKSIIISLWPVDDAATKELIVSFYQEWLNSGDMKDAFRTAQGKLRETHEEPYYWGGFIMIGT